MSVIQAVSYPVSALVQSQSQTPAAAAAAAAAKPSAPAAGVTAKATALSNRVNAYIATERTNSTRSDRDKSEHANPGPGSGGETVELDEDQTYRPPCCY